MICLGLRSKNHIVIIWVNFLIRVLAPIAAKAMADFNGFTRTVVSQILVGEFPLSEMRLVTYKQIYLKTS